MFVFLQSVRATHKPQQLGLGRMCLQEEHSWVGAYFKIKSQRKKRYQCRDEPICRCCTDFILNWHDLFSTKVTCATSIPWLYNFRLPCELWCLIANPQDNCNGVLIHRWPLVISLTSFLLCCAVSMISDVNTPSSLYVKLNSRSIQYR